MKIDTGQILKVQKEFAGLWSLCHTQMDTAEALNDGDILVKGREGAKKHVPPYAFHAVHSMASAVLTENLVITVPPRKDTEEFQKTADKIEKFYTALVPRLDKDQLIPLLRQEADSVILYGMSVRKGPLWNPATPERPKKATKEALSRWELARNRILPIKAFVLDPRSVMWEVGPTWPPPYIIETSTRRTAELNELYGKEPGWVALEGKETEWVECWDEEKYVYLAGGRVVREAENIAGFLPYTIVVAPFGRHPSTRFKVYDPAAFIRGRLFALESTLEAMAQEATDMKDITTLFAHPNKVVPTKPGQEEEARRVAEQWNVPGGTIINTTDGLLVYAPAPPISASLLQWHSILASNLEQVSQANLRTGQPGGTVTSGYQGALYQSWSGQDLKPIIAGLKRAQETFLGNVGRLIEAFDEEMTVWAYSKDGGRVESSVKAGDWDGYYEVHCELSAVTPEEADRRTTMGLAILRDKALSHRTVIESFFMRPNAQEEIDRMLIEEVENTPQFKEMLALEAFKAAGREELIQKAAETPEREPTPEMMAGLGMGGQPPFAPPRPARAGSPEEAELRMRQLRRFGPLGGQAGQGETPPVTRGRWPQ